MGQSVKKDALTLKQRRFVEEYAADGNAVQAYFRAYGRRTAKGSRRSYGVAAEEASRLLKKPDILAELAVAQEAWKVRIGVDKERVLAELAALAFADPDDVYEPDAGNGGLPVPKPWRDIPPATRKAIQSVKVKRKRLKNDKDSTAWEVEELEYRFHSKTDALDKLCKKLGFYTDPGSGADAIGELLRGLIRGTVAERGNSVSGPAQESGPTGGGGPAAPVADAPAPATD
jgi:phage terminase small subunit